MGEKIKEIETAITSSLDLGAVNEQASGEVETPKDDETTAIASLKNNKGWQEIEEYIKGRLIALDNFEIEGLPVEVIGYRYALNAALRKDLQAIIDIVDSNYEYEKGRREKGTE